MADSRIGVGMPAALLLNQFGSYVWDAFGDTPYLVGSALKGDKSAGQRDVDVRVILDDEEYARQGYGEANREEHRNGKWVAMCLAFSALGRQVTGLPIDFQIQQRTWANDANKGEPRSALGLVPLRFTEGAHE